MAVAEACGWTEIGTATDLSEPQNYGTKPGMTVKAARGHWKLPDYYSDLNACREMEEHLQCDAAIFPTDEWTRYSKLLSEWVGEIDIFHASPEMRTEAFLIIKGLWRK